MGCRRPKRKHTRARRPQCGNVSPSVKKTPKTSHGDAETGTACSTSLSPAGEWGTAAERTQHCGPLEGNASPVSMASPAHITAALLLLISHVVMWRAICFVLRVEKHNKTQQTERFLCVPISLNFLGWRINCVYTPSPPDIQNNSQLKLISSQSLSLSLMIYIAPFVQDMQPKALYKKKRRKQRHNPPC